MAGGGNGVPLMCSKTNHSSVVLNVDELNWAGAIGPPKSAPYPLQSDELSELA